MKKILGAAIGDCIHVAGLLNFLELARNMGFQPMFLGPSVSIEVLIQAIKRGNPEIAALSYRLSSESCGQILAEFEKRILEENLLTRDYIFGGTVTTAEIARKTGIFKRVFDGTEPIEEVISFLQGGVGTAEKAVKYPDSLIERIAERKPFPLLRHHLGLPSVEETIRAAEEIAESKLLDVISIAPDQTAQESFFRPDAQKGLSEGAGGVPVRKDEDFAGIYNATRRGNHPLLRCYSGTLDVLQWAEMLHRTIKNAWCAVPLFWYNVMDKRGPRSLKCAMQEAQMSMRWHADRDVPVEVNEAHQWSLRRASDTIAVATAFLAAYNAKKMGVKHYVSQYMLGTPGLISPKMDLAKMLAKIDMIESLHDDSFHSYREVRAGLLSFPVDLDAAKGQLGFSTILGLMLEPQIIHVVAYSEGQYAAGTEEIIKSCKIANHIIGEYLRGFPGNLVSDPEVQQQREKLKIEAQVLLDAIKDLGKDSEDAFIEPDVLTMSVKIGLLDAPDLRGNPVAKGQIVTSIVDGACVAIDPRNGKPLTERERIKQILA